jgi:hypothetical protein
VPQQSPSVTISALRIRRARRAACTIVAAALALLLAPAGASAVAPTTGINLAWSGPDIPNLIAPLNAQYVRVFVRWNEIETAKGVYDQGRLGYTDETIRGYRPGTKVVVDLSGTPGWANGGQAATAPPANPQDYADFLHFLAARYRGQVAGWELWNEEDAPVWFTGSAAQYTALLQAAYPAVKAADPGATVLVGGLTGNDYHFLEQIYANGGGPAFDAVAVHTDTACNLVSPYSYFRDADGRIDQFSFLGYREVYKVMQAHGDGAKPIWMTEFGWSTTTSTCISGKWAGQKAGGVTEADQALFMRQALHCVAGDGYVPVMIWFELRNNGALNTSEDRFGLLRYDGTEKPAWQALQTYDAQGDTLHDACGNFSGPKLSLVAPRPNLRYHGPLLIKVSASSSYGVPRITIFNDGKRIRNFTSKAHPALLEGKIHWMGAKHISRGKHVISALAIDPMGNQTTTSVVVYHV